MTEYGCVLGFDGQDNFLVVTAALTGILIQTRVDATNGIETEVDGYPANRRESDIILEHLFRMKQVVGLTIKICA